MAPKISVNYFPIHRRSFFFIMVSLLVVFLVMANNYFYYQSRDDLAEKNLRTLTESLSGQYLSCLGSNIDLIKCQSILSIGVKKYWSYGKVSIIDSQGTLIVDADKETYGEDRSKVLYDQVAGSGQNRIHIVLSKRSSPPLWKSTLRSLFFSLWELPEHKDKTWFFTSVAIKRSSPLIYSVIAMFILFSLIRISEKQKRKIYAKIEAENFIVTNDLETVRDNLKLQQTRENALGEKIKALEKSETNLLDEYLGEMNQLELEIEKLRARENMLKALEEKQKETLKALEKATSKEDKSLKNLFLENPKIELHDESFDYNDGNHHSRAFVEQIAIGLSKDQISSRLITKVNSTRYNSNESKEAKLEWNSIKKIYVLNVYGGDSGFAAEVVLNQNAVESAYIAKYLLSGKNFLAKKDFTLKIGLLR